MIVYKDQTAVRFILNTNIDLSVYLPQSVTIEYVKPSNTKGSFPAQVLDGPSGTIYIDFDDTHKFNESGNWKVWSKIVFSDGRIGVGKVITYHVELEPTGKI